MNTRFEEPRHPIGVAVERTGLSADVIRAWERRYGAVVPDRDDSGQRQYTDAELERLRLLRQATEGGRSISQVAELDLEALAELVRGDRAARREMAGVTGEEEESPLPELEAAAMALDGSTLEAGLRKALLDRGFVGFAETVAAPLLRRLGEGWHGGTVSIAQEHLATATLRRVLESTREPMGESGGPVAVVTTLEGERHEAGALMVATAATLAGWRIAYLGASLPVEEVAEAVQTADARAVCVSGTYAGNGNAGLVAGLRRLRNALPSEVAVYAGGLAAESVQEELEQFGVICPPNLLSLRLALRRQSTDNNQ